MLCHLDLGLEVYVWLSQLNTQLMTPISMPNAIKTSMANATMVAGFLPGILVCMDFSLIDIAG